MQKINEALNRVINKDLTINTTKAISSGEPRSLKNLTKEGINALDLIGEKADTDDINRAVAYIEAAFGVPASDEKVMILAELILDDGWSKERLDKVIKHFLKTTKWKDWTPADLFGYGVKLHPYSWYMEQINKGVKHEEMEAYKVHGQVLWKLKDGNELPFEKIKDCA
jgi:hypothetical protein